MREKGAISGLVNVDPEFRFTMYHVNQPCSYNKIEYKVGDELIPEKYLSLKSQDKLRDKMYSILNKDEIIKEILRSDNSLFGGN